MQVHADMSDPSEGRIHFDAAFEAASRHRTLKCEEADFHRAWLRLLSSRGLRDRFGIGTRRRRDVMDATSDGSNDLSVGYGFRTHQL